MAIQIKRIEKALKRARTIAEKVPLLEARLKQLQQQMAAAAAGERAGAAAAAMEKQQEHLKKVQGKIDTLKGKLRDLRGAKKTLQAGVAAAQATMAGKSEPQEDEACVGMDCIHVSGFSMFFVVVLGSYRFFRAMTCCVCRMC